MNDADFLTAVREYIEEMEMFLEDERGKGLSVEELIALGRMPKIYAEALRRLDCAKQAEHKLLGE